MNQTTLTKKIIAFVPLIRDANWQKLKPSEAESFINEWYWAVYDCCHASGTNTETQRERFPVWDLCEQYLNNIKKIMKKWGVTPPEHGRGLNRTEMVNNNGDSSDDEDYGQEVRSYWQDSKTRRQDFINKSNRDRNKRHHK